MAGWMRRWDGKGGVGEWMDGWVDGWVDRLMDGWMNRRESWAAIGTKAGDRSLGGSS